MIEKNDFDIHEFEGLRLKRITASDDFATKVINRVAKEETGGLSAMTSKMKILTIVVLFIVYGGMGIIIGAQSWKSKSQSSIYQNNKETFLRQFIEEHHINSVSEIDKIFR